MWLSARGQPKIDDVSCCMDGQRDDESFVTFSFFSSVFALFDMALDFFGELDTTAPRLVPGFHSV